jgi:putative membrane protein
VPVSVIAPLVVCTLAATLYGLGGRGRVGTRARGRRRREACFYGGVLILLLALEPPVDGLADSSFAVHMGQHVLLLTVVPPLVVLGRPWPRMWLPFPADARRAAARGLARGRWSAPLRLAARALATPPAALSLLAAALVVWHLPAMYDAAVNSELVHLGEHTAFLVPALLFWGPLLEAPPVKSRIAHVRRAGWFALAVVPGWILAIVLAFAHHPLYPAPTSSSRRA